MIRFTLHVLSFLFFFFDDLFRRSFGRSLIVFRWDWLLGSAETECSCLFHRVRGIVAAVHGLQKTQTDFLQLDVAVEELAVEFVHSYVRISRISQVLVASLILEKKLFEWKMDVFILFYSTSWNVHIHVRS